MAELFAQLIRVVGALASLGRGTSDRHVRLVATYVIAVIGLALAGAFVYVSVAQG